MRGVVLIVVVLAIHFAASGTLANVLTDLAKPAATSGDGGGTVPSLVPPAASPPARVPGPR